MKLLAVANLAGIEGHDTSEGAVAQLSKQLNTAFLVYRGLMSGELKKSPATSTTEETAKVVIEAASRIKDYWSANFSPNIKAGLKIGGLDDPTAAIMAGKYAGKLADQINEVSDRAFLQGYHAALNKNWDKALAWQRISEAYGIDPAQMRKWVSYYPEDGYHPQDIPDKSRSLLNKMLGERGKRIGEHESWSIKQIGKQTYWSQQVASGNIPATAKKVWYTARDELVCPVCAPLDGIAIAITEEFDTGSGDFFVPPLHVNCRCEINLQFPDVVTKAMGKDTYNRDKNGRFASIESRAAKKSVGQYKFVDDPKWNQQINADLDRIVSEPLDRNYPEWAEKHKEDAHRLYAKWLDSPSGPFSESFGDTRTTPEVMGYLEWLGGIKDKPVPEWGDKPLKKISSEPAKSLPKKEVEAMRKWNSDEHDGSFGHEEQSFDDYLKEGSYQYDDDTGEYVKPFTRSATVTRGSNSQPQKKSTGQASVKRLIVQEPPKKKIPYGSEKISKITPSEKIVLERASEATATFSPKPKVAQAISDDVNINKLREYAYHRKQHGLTTSASDRAKVRQAAEKTLEDASNDKATAADIAEKTRDLKAVEEVLYEPSEVPIAASGTAIENALPEGDELQDGTLLKLSDTDDPSFSMSTDVEAMLNTENDLSNDMMLADATREEYTGEVPLERVRTLVYFPPGTPSIVDEYGNAEVVGDFILHLAEDLRIGDTWDNRTSGNYSEWSDEGIDVGAVKDNDDRQWKEQPLRVLIAEPVASKE